MKFLKIFFFALLLLSSLSACEPQELPQETPQSEKTQTDDTTAINYGDKGNKGDEQNTREDN